MKKYLFIALAALGLAACAEKMDDNSTPNGELEEAYIAINLMSADANTRAATDAYGYEEGTQAERAIHSAHFFFFDANGNPFNVLAADKEPATAPGGNKNHLALNISDVTTSGMPNISDIREAILVLNTYKGVYPSKIVAVLNWTPSDQHYTLAQLHEVMENSIGNDAGGYVMSNSVYMDAAGNVVDAVPLTASNIKTTANAAIAAPIDIYVERTAAKVVLTASGKVENSENIFDTKKDASFALSNAVSQDVYVQLHGWELYNDYGTSSLLKNIDTKWDINTLGLTWNDIPYYRCYWAQSQSESHTDKFAWSYTDEDKAKNGFQTQYGFAVANENDKYATRSTYTYCGENTNSIKASPDLSTKVILKAQLKQKNNDGTYSNLELARWYGTEYAGNEALRTAVANSLIYTLFYSENGKDFHPIGPSDLECVAGSVMGVESYEVGFQLSDAGEKRTWYQYSSAGGYSIFGDSATSGDNAAKANFYLKNNVEPALLYTEGYTYYIVDIKHLGQEGKTAEYGVVRNHVYQIDIKSINGYGTPVYNGMSNIVTPPEYPEEDEASYVAARINVLSWKVVKQGVNVGE